MEIPQPKLKELAGLLASAYELAELKLFLRVWLGLELSDLVPQNLTFPQTISELLATLNRRGRIVPLVSAMKEERRDRQDVQSFQLGEPTGVDQPTASLSSPGPAPHIPPDTQASAPGNAGQPRHFWRWVSLVLLGLGCVIGLYLTVALSLAVLEHQGGSHLYFQYLVVTLTATAFWVDLGVTVARRTRPDRRREANGGSATGTPFHSTEPPHEPGAGTPKHDPPVQATRPLLSRPLLRFVIYISVLVLTPVVTRRVDPPPPPIRLEVSDVAVDLRYGRNYIPPGANDVFDLIKRQEREQLLTFSVNNLSEVAAELASIELKCVGRPSPIWGNDIRDYPLNKTKGSADRFPIVDISEMKSDDKPVVISALTEKKVIGAKESLKVQVAVISRCAGKWILEVLVKTREGRVFTGNRLEIEMPSLR